MRDDEEVRRWGGSWFDGWPQVGIAFQEIQARHSSREDQLIARAREVKPWIVGEKEQALLMKMKRERKKEEIEKNSGTRKR